MNKMNAFRGTDAASLAFKKELVRLAPGYYLGDLHRHIYMTGQDLVRDAGTAYQEGLAGEDDATEEVKPAHQRKPGNFPIFLFKVCQLIYLLSNEIVP